MLREFALAVLQLPGRELIGEAVVENYEQGAIPDKRVRSRVSGLDFKQSFRLWRPNIVISRHKKRLKTSITTPNNVHFTPFRDRCFVLAALDDVPNRDGQVRSEQARFTPNPGVDLGRGGSGPVPDQGESESASLPASRCQARHGA